MRGLFQSIWYVLTLRCEEADRIRSISRREDLTGVERFGASAHSLVCRGCWIARKQADKLESLVRDMRESEPEVVVNSRMALSEDRRNRLAKALEAEVERSE